MIVDAIHKLIEKENLSKEESYSCFMDIMSGKASDGIIASFLTALRMKGEVVSEISGAALAMREMATKIVTTHENVIDTCGTGGDGLGTFNISTAAAIVASAAGAKVAKHGNRAISSKCGSADVLKALGVNIEIPKEKVEASLNELGIAFLFAPLLHGAMKYATPVRRELGIRTIFNILGPLTNPAGAKRQLLGVFKPVLTEVLANVLMDLGTEKALIVHGIGGLDELSTIGESRITEISNGNIHTYTFKNEDAGISRTEISTILGGNSEMNVDIIQRVFNNEKGAALDIVALNAGAALYVSGIADSIKQGTEISKDAIATKKAKIKLKELIEFSNA